MVAHFMMYSPLTPAPALSRRSCRRGTAAASGAAWPRRATSRSRFSASAALCQPLSAPMCRRPETQTASHSRRYAPRARRPSIAHATRTARARIRTPRRALALARALQTLCPHQRRRRRPLVLWRRMLPIRPRLMLVQAAMRACCAPRWSSCTSGTSSTRWPPPGCSPASACSSMRPSAPMITARTFAAWARRARRRPARVPCSCGRSRPFRSIRRTRVCAGIRNVGNTVPISVQYMFAAFGVPIDFPR
jgi:hypothetical protein